jgi:hypothetical protein
LSRYNISSGTVDTPVSLDNFIPTDITTFTLGGTDYLALIGRNASGQMQAWKAMLSSGTVGQWTKTSLGTDGGLDFQCSISSDGSLMWYASPAGQYVGVLNTATWNISAASINVGDQISGLVGLKTNMTPVVPEPSSLLALASFGAGAIGLFRKKKNG